MLRIRFDRNLILGLLLTAVLSACGSEKDMENESSTSKSQPARVALVMKSLANEYFINMM